MTARNFTSDSLSSVTVGLPQLLTGCVSDISFPEVRNRDYADAVSDYWAVYQAFESYSLPGNAMSGSEATGQPCLIDG